MLITTTDTVQGYEVIKYLGIVTAEVVYGTNVLRDFLAGIRDVIGGRTSSYENLFEKGQLEAIKKLEKRAQKLAAHGVIGIKVDTDTINLDDKGVLFLITATGTAVQLESSN